MRYEDRLPHDVIEEPNAPIPMTDGVELAARIWRADASSPVPAILEYVPYRKRFGTTARDTLTHPYLAGHGYASVRVDLRGSGESQGVLRGEYLQQELDDAVEVIDWIAAQPWCDGKVGMMGISWGGFNALQVAAMRPAPLGAIVTLCSTDDRYADDIHYMGGCLLADHLSWASVMLAYNTMPPDPELVGDRWREEWMRRMEDSGLWLDEWLQHQTRDQFWRHGSVGEDYSAIECPVYAVSGWADGYSNAVLRLLAGLDVPRKGLIGPWSHAYPHIARPGPAIGFLQELLRWWDHWLKGKDTGIMDEPQLRVWMQGPAPPATSYSVRPGRWAAEDRWPSPSIQPGRWWLGSGGALTSGVPEEAGVVIDSPLWVGRQAGKWCSYGDGPDLPGDQRHDDAGSVTFDTGPLPESLEILGPPVLDLTVASDRPVAQIAARLSDIDEAGRATRVTYGVLNLTHRNGHEGPEPLEPGKPYRIRLQLNDVAQHFAPGHRIRLSLSSSYWPLIWPSPETARLTVSFGESNLTLPVRPQRLERDLADFPEPEGTTPTPRSYLRPPRSTWTLTQDQGTGVHALDVVDDSGHARLDDIGLEVETRAVERYQIVEGEPTSARGEVITDRRMQRPGWSVATTTRTVLGCTDRAFTIEASLVALENGEEVLRRTWTRRVPRHLM